MSVNILLSQVSDGVILNAVEGISTESAWSASQAACDLKPVFAGAVELSWPPDELIAT